MRVLSGERGEMEIVAVRLRRRGVDMESELRLAF